MRLRGSKNAATKHMVAAILGEGPSQIGNVPEVGDVAITRDMLRSLGAEVEHDEAHGVITVGRREQLRTDVPLSFAGINRIPVLLLGPLLHLTSEAFVPLLGGDPIGRRPVDFHLDALTARRPGRGPHGAAQRGDRAGGHRARPVPATDRGPDRAVPRPQVDHQRRGPAARRAGHPGEATATRP